jgi:YHS domain-containing protein
MFAAVLLCSCAIADDAARNAAKEKLQPLQDFVGEWKGAGQRERGRTDGGWIEKSHWAWNFSGELPAIAFTSTDAKYLATGTILPGKESGEYQLTIQSPDKVKSVYVGKLDKDKLVLESDKPAEGLPARISLRLVAEGKRLVALYEVKSNASDRYVRLAEVGYTRVGSGFGQGSQGPECIVTGGLGTIKVAYNGQTYYVCCTGCKDYFDEDPKRAVEEYLAKKEKEKKGKQ